MEIFQSLNILADCTRLRRVLSLYLTHYEQGLNRGVDMVLVFKGKCRELENFNKFALLDSYPGSNCICRKMVWANV